MLILNVCIDESLNYDDKFAFLTDMAQSIVWYDNDMDKWAEHANRGDLIPEERLDALSKLYDATHRSVRDIAKECDMSQRKLAEWFDIPYSTMENWCRGVNECPLYTRLMMQECLGLYDPKLFLKTIRVKRNEK